MDWTLPNENSTCSAWRHSRPLFMFKISVSKNITTAGTLAKVTLSLSNVVIKGLETHSNNIPLEASLESIAAWMNFVPG